MKKIICILIFGTAIFCCSCAYPQSVKKLPDDDCCKSLQIELPALVGKKTIAAVFPFQIKKDVSSELISVLSDQFFDEIVRLGRFNVIDRENLRNIIKEQEIQTSDFFDENRAIKAGVILGSEIMLNGSVGKFGDKYVFFEKITNLESGKILASENLECSCSEDELSNVSRNLARKLVYKSESNKLDKYSKRAKALEIYWAEKYSEAEPLLHEVVEANPEDIEAHARLGLVLQKGNQFQESKEELEKALKGGWDDAWIHGTYGFTLLNLGKFNESEKEFRRSLEINPNDSWAHGKLGHILISKGKLDEAEREMRTSLQLKSAEESWVRSKLGYILELQNKREEAIVEYNKAIEIDPNNSFAKKKLNGFKK